MWDNTTNDFIEDFPELILDVSAEAICKTGGAFMVLDMSVYCFGVDIGYYADAVINISAVYYLLAFQYTTVRKLMVSVTY